ncbi:hypothetical protein XI06_28620 [Bradyrhizobium sp. CCBAU 11434]|nr:hypothetical protein [Bradyrhizobium sp. CCBAU 11434]
MYRLLRNDGFSNPNPFIHGAERSLQTSKQAQQHLLCSDCEQRFSKRGEAWVMSHCWRSVGEFRIQQILFKSNPIIANDTLKIYAGSAIPKLDMDKLVYFGASVFWRAAVCEWSLSSERINIQLGGYREELRRYLLDEAMFPRNVVLHIGVSALSGTLDACLFPKSSRTKTGIHRHRFIIPGMYFTMLAGSKISDNERFLCAAQSSGRHISIWHQSDREFLAGSMKKIFAR